MEQPVPKTRHGKKKKMDKKLPPAPPPKPSRLGVHPVARSAPDPSPSPESVPVAQNLKNEQIENNEQQGSRGLMVAMPTALSCVMPKKQKQPAPPPLPAPRSNSEIHSAEYSPEDEDNLSLASSMTSSSSTNTPIGRSEARTKAAEAAAGEDEIKMGMRQRTAPEGGESSRPPGDSMYPSLSGTSEYPRSNQEEAELSAMAAGISATRIQDNEKAAMDINDSIMSEMKAHDMSDVMSTPERSMSDMVASPEDGLSPPYNLPVMGPPPTYSPPMPDRAAASKPPMLLGHKDFPPRQIRKGKDGCDTIVDLIQRANEWLTENPDIHLSSVENVTWMSVDKKKFYTDNAMVFKSMSAHNKRTKMARGLRLWYFKRDDKFWNHGPSSIQHIGFRDYLLGKSSSIQAALYELNTDIKTKPINGNLSKVETLYTLSECSTLTCIWKERPDAHRDFVMFLRFFYITWNDAPAVKAEIALRDFIPRFDDRSPHSQGYEKYTDLFERAAKWLYRQPANHRCINIQSFYVKYKKQSKDVLDIWDRTQYREHECSQKTEYLRIIRVVTVHLPEVRKPAPEAYKLSYRTFAAAALTNISAIPAADVSETCFEDLRYTVEKIGKWIYASSARVVSIETVPVRWVTGGQNVDGSETTFCYNHKLHQKEQLEQWVYYIRIYIDGDYNSDLALPSTTY